MAGSDARDLSTIYAAMRDPLLRFLRRRVRDASVADDLLHDVFLRVHDHVDSLRDVRCLESWIYQIARNAVIDRQRRERLALPVDPELLQPGSPDDNEAQRELAALVPRCIEHLPEPYREALRATTFESVAHSELAARWGLSVSGAKSRVQRARRMLAALYEECCHLEFDARGKVIAYTPRDPCCRRDRMCGPRS